MHRFDKPRLSGHMPTRLEAGRLKSVIEKRWTIRIYSQASNFGAYKPLWASTFISNSQVEGAQETSFESLIVYLVSAPRGHSRSRRRSFSTSSHDRPELRVEQQLATCYCLPLCDLFLRCCICVQRQKSGDAGSYRCLWCGLVVNVGSTTMA